MPALVATHSYLSSIFTRSNFLMLRLPLLHVQRPGISTVLYKGAALSHAAPLYTLRVCVRARERDLHLVDVFFSMSL